jgi:hypothetical protein
MYVCMYIQQPYRTLISCMYYVVLYSYSTYAIPPHITLSTCVVAAVIPIVFTHSSHRSGAAASTPPLDCIAFESLLPRRFRLTHSASAAIMSLSKVEADRGFSLKACQLRAVHRMLSLPGDEGNAAATTGTASLNLSSSSHQGKMNQWKILIYDAPCRSIISPILSVQQLRRAGVTLHLLLSADREAIPDVPAVYFCRPTAANLARIAQDAANNLYPAGMYLNFCPKLERADMEQLAKLVVQTQSLQRIASLHDQYVSYVCLENTLFSLQQQNSYQIINSHTTTETQMQALLQDTAHGLLSVIASAGVLPIIRCPRNGAPEMVARLLHKLLLEQSHLVQSSSSSGNRPLLVILDRNADLLTALQHTSTYQALIDDLLSHKANRVEFDVQPAADAPRSSKTVHKRFDLDPDQEPFYQAQKFRAFPEAIESNSKELQQVTERETAIKTQSASASDALASAVDSLPALLERKRQLEVHTSILQAVMNQVAARDVPQYYELETALVTGQYKNDVATAKTKVLALVASVDKGNLSDKVRLVLCFGLATTASAADWQEVRQALEEVATTGLQAPRQEIMSALAALDYVQKVSSLQRMVPMAAAAASSSAAPSSGAETSQLLASFMAKATTQATGLLAKATDKVAGMMMGKIHKHHATVVVENLLDYKAEDDSFLYLDPKVATEVNVQQLKESGIVRAPVKQVWVFPVGGGSYAEYQNLQLLQPQVTYGSTEILNATQFWHQLGALGNSN